MSLEHEELTRQVIGCAYQVYNRLGFGFVESVYEKSLMIALRKARLAAVSQQPIDVFYEGELVGEFIADMVVEGKVIVELKAVSALVPAHEVQLVNYLVATCMTTGLLLNFGAESVEIKRKFRVFKKKQET